MSERDDGGPAYPFSREWNNERKGTVEREACDGMTLRDYFAAKAMQAQVITDLVPGETCDELLEAAAAAGQDPLYRLALGSYEIADAMLKARQA